MRHAFQLIEASRLLASATPRASCCREMMLIPPHDQIAPGRRLRFTASAKYAVRALSGAFGLTLTLLPPLVWGQSTLPIGGTPTPISTPVAAAAARATNESPEAARLRADALAKRGQVGQALTLTRGLLRAVPANPEYRLMEAQQLGWLGRTASAGARYSKLLQENPSDAGAAEGLGNTQLWRGNWHEALSAYAKASSVNADNLSAQVGFYRALTAAGRATPAYRQAADLDRRTGGRDAELGLLLASLHGTVDDDDTAFALANRRTSDPDVRLRQTAFQAQRLLVHGRKAEGLNLIASHAEARGQDYNALVAAGDAFTTAGDFRTARSYFERATQLAPDRDEAILGFARVARQQNKLRDALSFYEEVALRNPESVPAWLGIAEVAQQSGNLNRAWQALDSAQRVAPGSALVFRERLKIAFREKDADTFLGVLRDYQRAQPADAWPVLWAQKWADAHGGEVNPHALQSLLDPLAPDLTSEAPRLLRRHTGEPLQQVVQRVPAAPGAGLQEAAREKLGRQARLAGAGIVGISTGYEFASLQDTSGAGAQLQAWHEGYLAAYWRQPLGMSVSGEYRTFSRFGASANQLLLGWSTHVTPKWILGLDAGGAVNGGFIPRWRLGARTEYLFSDTVSASLAVSHLRFADEPVFQVIPGLTWQWHPQWSSHVRMFVTHTEPKGARGNTGLAGLFSTTWQFSPLSSTTISYTMGEENASQLIKGLIGEKNFQSVGVDLKYGFNEKLSLQPTYRYESHNLFDLHAIGVNLHLRY